MVPGLLARHPILYTGVVTSGAWRSPVAHRYGVPVVGGSNPLAPTRVQVFFPNDEIR